MTSSRDGNANTPSIENLMDVLNGMATLLKKDPTLSNAGRILTQLKQLQTVYQKLDPDVKKIIDEHLIQNNQKLYNALQKKSGSNKQAAAAKVFEDGNIIHDDLRKELEIIAKKNSDLISMKTTAIPSYETEAESDFFMTDTVRVTDTKGADHSLQAALDSAAHHKDQTDYIANSLFGTLDTEPLHPLSAAIEALDALRKTKINKDKIQSGEPKPQGFDNAYREALLKQINILNNNKDVLQTIELDAHLQSILTKIGTHLTDLANANIPTRLTRAGAISELVTIDLMANLRRIEAKFQPDTPRYQ